MRKRVIVLALCLASIEAEAQPWQPRASAEFPFWTAAVRGGEASQFIAGYGFELALERDVRPGLAFGASLVMMRGLTPAAIGCDTGGGVDACGDPLSHSQGFFATARQFLTGSSSSGHLAALFGAGVYQFLGRPHGKHDVDNGPAFLYGAQAVTPTFWGIALTANIRAQLAFEAGAKPLHATTATFGFRVR